MMTKITILIRYSSMSKSVFCFVSSAPVAKRAAPDFDAGRPGRRAILKLQRGYAAYNQQKRLYGLGSGTTISAPPLVLPPLFHFLIVKLFRLMPVLLAFKVKVYSLPATVVRSLGVPSL